MIILLVFVLGLLIHGCAERPKQVNNLDPIIDNPNLTLQQTDQGKYVRFTNSEYEIEAAAFAFGRITYKYGRGYRDVILDDDSIILVDLKIVNKTDKKIIFKDYQVMLFDVYDNNLYRWPEDRIKTIVSLSLGEGMPANTALAQRVLSNLKENYFLVDEALLPKETRRGFLAFTKTGDKKIRYPVKLDIVVEYPPVIMKFNKKSAPTDPSLFSY